MNTKWIVALACSAALALGACSGSNPAPAAGNGDGGNGGAGNGDGNGDGDGNGGTDDRTADQMAFDTELGEARMELADAKDLVAAAESAAAAANTDEARMAAQTAINNARKALADAVASAEALEAPEGDFDRIGNRANLIDDAKEDQTEGEASLRAAEGLTGWSGSALLSRAVSRNLVMATRTARKEVDDATYTDDGDDLDTALTWEKIPAVMYEDGKIVMRPGQGGSGDRLRMRGMPVRWSNSTNGFTSTTNAPLTATNDWFDRYVAGLTITPEGLVVDYGVDSDTAAVKFGPDLAINPAAEPDAQRQVGSNRYDLSLDFGRPSASPTGNAEHSWIAALMPTDDQLDVAAAALFLKDGTATRPLGTYHVRLSNHAGVDTNLEDPDDAETSARDDTNHYLSYAAYGVFYFVANENFPAGTEASATTLFPFATGYDAFKDETGMKTTDVAEADKITSGTFRGRTIAEDVYMRSNGSNAQPFGDPHIDGGNYNEGQNMRGDIVLTATISPTADDNKIKGTISNLESWDPTGHWEAYGEFTTATLEEGSIGADGAFSGVVTDPDEATGTDFRAGYYKGSFYGPLSGLEAAGTWIVPVGTSGVRAVVGSFGAALVQEGGAYGHCIAGPQGSCP